ncbi:type II CAAX endopeptidase family protein [Sedimentitalea sp. JM2-8]|uniref:Type II CAAX endopeptidase family protein n=1 Tax=Sedimentitalea xiamensis TaxID=3050037 RepID=A0ABT7FJK1_9RHOB|nr:type II CAAX endopeptidase family protein [Sedimentitalea xiamensis]MDK3075291.1 type II CAAX endopeptidase family protein [Sedimentitalea xiamensis]
MDLKRNPLVGLADVAKRPSRWWAAWIVTIVIILTGGIAGTIVGAAVLGDDVKSPLHQYSELFVFGFTLLALFLWVRLKEGRPLSTVGFRGAGGVRKFALGLAIGGAMMALPVLFLLIVGIYEAGASYHTVSGTAALLPIVPLLAVFAIQGSTEEAVVRGYMLQMGARQLPGWAAILGSSFLFAIVHVTFEPLILAVLGVYAVFACLVALQQGSLWLISGIHVGWNFCQGNVFGLPVSGHPRAAALFSIGPAEGSSDILSGGDYGVEASLPGLVILIVALMIAWWAFSNRPAGPTENTSRGTAL